MVAFGMKLATSLACYQHKRRALYLKAQSNLKANQQANPKPKPANNPINQPANQEVNHARNSRF